MRMCRLKAIPIVNKNQLQRDYSRDKFSTIYTKDLLVTASMDNKPVYMISNCYPSEPQISVKRRDGMEKKLVELPIPAIIEAYNHEMGGVDLCLHAFMPGV